LSSQTATIAAQKTQSVYITTIAPICEAAFQKPVNSRRPARPLFFLLKRDYEDTGWMQVVKSNAKTISFPFIEGHNPSDIQSLICIQESRILVDNYISGDPLYQLNWNVRLVSLPSGEVIGTTMLAGPRLVLGKVYGSGPAYNSGPRDELLRWILSSLGETTIIVHRGVTGISFSPDGATLASSSGMVTVVTGEENSVKLWDVVTGRLISTLDEGNDVKSVIFSPDGNSIAFSLRKGIVKIVDIATRREIRLFNRRVLGSDALSFSPDGKTIAMGDWSGQVELLDVKTGQSIRRLNGNTEGIDILAFSADGSKVAVLGNQGTPKLWETSTGDLIAKSIVRSKYGYASLAFSPDGKTLALSTPDDNGNLSVVIRLFDVKTGKLKQTLVASGPQHRPITFSPDGLILATSGFDNEIKLWSLGTGRVLRTLTGHTDSLKKLTFSHDGRLLASASKDNTIKLWNIASGQ
jgi:WD40 repeat protein